MLTAVANNTAPKPVVLIILDGWGYREPTQHNAIKAAHIPNWQQLWQTCPHTLISGSGEAVGLPSAQMGNSEVGHLTMGAGRTIYQELTRIDKAIADGNFFSNPTLLAALEQAKIQHKAVHVLGLLSPGGVHSHEQHIFALLQLAAQQQVPALFVHAILDGRDTPPQSAEASLQALEAQCDLWPVGKVASLQGRYYAMDRDKRWERIEPVYDLLTLGQANYYADTALAGLQLAYERGETDEFVQATRLANFQPINDGDVVIFMNFRSDRARQLTRAFTDPHFTGFERKRWPQIADFVSLTQYAADIPTRVAFASQTLSNILAAYIAERGLKQLRIAETEKYAHVTFFFNGGVETPFAGEERCLIPSPKVATYDLQPEMSAPEITARLVAAIKSQKYDLIVVNYANPDMVGHTGNFKATVRAIEVIDSALGQIVQALQEIDGAAIITADHGNAEYMFDETTQQAHTAHTTEPVPVVYWGRRSATIRSFNQGTLADIAPTLLYLLGLPPPPEMTGQSLLSFA